MSRRQSLHPFRKCHQKTGSAQRTLRTVRVSQDVVQNALVRSLQDSDERAVANIGGGAPNRWGKGDKYHQEACVTGRLASRCWHFRKTSSLWRAQIMETKGFSWDAPNSKLKDHPPSPQLDFRGRGCVAYD